MSEGVRQIETQTLAAVALEGGRLWVRWENVEVAEHASQHLLGHYQDRHRLTTHSNPCSRIAPPPDRLHASLALLPLLAAPEFSAGS